MTPIKTFLFFLCDTPTGNCYYLDSGGNIQTASIHSGNLISLALKNAPDGWLSSELGFARNTHYYGINRSYTLPLKLVGDGATIVRQLYYLGRGIETPLTMIILKYNDNPDDGDPQYQLYYKGQLDLPKNVDFAGEGISCNLMEGGVIQTLKAFENAVWEIPCDGSIPENIKVNFDGLMLEGTFFDQIVPFTDTFGDFISILPTVGIDTDGDNIGIQHGNQTLEDANLSLPTNPQFFAQSANFLYGSVAATTIRIQGSIVVQSKDLTLFAALKVGFVTSLTLNPAGGDWKAYIIGSAAHPVAVKQQIVFPFDVTISLAANENLFFVYNNVVISGDSLFQTNIKFLLSSYNITTLSTAQPSAAWGLTAYDLWQKIGASINKASTTTDQVVNYRYDSALLRQKLNFVVTSGDALRASNDPNYKKFYNAVQVNPNFPNLDETFTFGPVIKISLAQFFDSINAILNASLSNQIVDSILIYQSEVTTIIGQGSRIKFGVPQDVGIRVGMTFIWNNVEYLINSISIGVPVLFTTVNVTPTPPQGTFVGQTFTVTQPTDGSESLFIERKDYVFDSSTDDFDMGEVRNLSHSFAQEYAFNSIKIGYPGQQYDQKSGKYEYNTTAEWIAPVKTLQKGLELISPIRTDSYGIERLRSGLSKTSITNNDSDNSVFLVNVENNSFIFDYYEASFLSVIQDITNPQNTNQRLLLAMLYQSTNQTVFHGSYESFSNTPAIFIFNQTLSAVHKTVTVSATGTMNGLPGDTITIRLWVNGGLVTSWTFIVPANLNFSISYSGIVLISTGDCIYCTVEASPTASAAISLFALGSTGDFLAQNAGLITVQQGSAKTLIQLPSVTATLDVNNHTYVSYGFQYFDFNSILANNNFNVLFSIAGLIFGTGQTVKVDIYRNGAPYLTFTYTATSDSVQPWGTSFNYNDNFNLGDLFWAVVSSSNNTNTYITQSDFKLTSTQIRAYSLKRLKYDAITGVPLLVGDSSQAGAPYNIEELTPKRMLSAWGYWLRGFLNNFVPSTLNFYSLIKNRYLATVLGTEQFLEDVDEPISDFDSPIYFPVIATFTTKVPDNFADVLTGAANAHVSWTYNNTRFFGYAMEVKQKPGLNEMQTWKVLLSTKTDLNDLVSLDIDGLKYVIMGANSIFAPPLNPVQFVPEGLVLPSKYHTKFRDDYWFSEQVTNWINQNNYWSPWMNTDQLQLQFQTNGLTPVVVNLYSCSGTLISTTTLTNVSNPAIVSPVQLWQGTVDLSILAGSDGGYYLEVLAGTSGTQAKLISEGLWVKSDWPGTILFEYTSTLNKQATVFVGTGFNPAMRVQGFIDNRMKPKYKGAFYVDQPQNIQILNSIPYETDELWVTGDDGVPDWVIKKVSRIMLLNSVAIEGIDYSLDEGAEWEETFTPGNPKKYWKAEIRKTSNIDGIQANASGIDTDVSMMVTMDANVVGPNAMNEGTQEPDIIQIITE